MKKSLKYFFVVVVLVLGYSLFSAGIEESTGLDRKSIKQDPSWDKVLGNLDLLVKGDVPEGLNTCLQKRYLLLQEKIMSAKSGITWEVLSELYLSLPEELRISLVNLSRQMYLGVLRISLDGCRSVFTCRSFTGGVGIQDDG
ncbi:MAG: hypothetical protein NT128_04575 [Proteobacteria bacterium]|nr:hypothetical protein [Pseudomonadota bacterium]